MSRQLISFFIVKQNPEIYADKLPIFEQKLKELIPTQGKKIIDFVEGNHLAEEALDAVLLDCCVHIKESFGEKIVVNNLRTIVSSI